jgi:hypothetical protein
MLKKYIYHHPRKQPKFTTFSNQTHVKKYATQAQPLFNSRKGNIDALFFSRENQLETCIRLQPTYSHLQLGVFRFRPVYFSRTKPGQTNWI